MPITDLNDVNHLYKYRYFDNENYHIRTILNNEFYFANKDELNDPFDLSLRPSYEFGTVEQISEYYVREIENYSTLTPNEKEQRKEAIQRSLGDPVKFRTDIIKSFVTAIKNYRMCSFSGNKWNDILMWAHYSNSNTGFCIGINWKTFSQYLWENNSNNMTPWVIKYGKEYPLFNPFIEGEEENAYRYLFSYKYLVWAYEEEVRLIMKKSTNPVLIIPNIFIDEVILGLNILEENKNLIINSLRQKDEKPKLYQIIQKEKNFEFEREEISY